MIIHRHDATALILIILIALLFPSLPSCAFPYFPQDIGDSQPPPQPAVLAQNLMAKDKSSGVVEKSQQQIAEQQQKQPVPEDQKEGGGDAEEGSRAPSSTTSIGIAKVESGERNTVSVEEVEELREPLDVVRGVITQIQESAEGVEAEEDAKPFHAQMDIQQPTEDGGQKEKSVEPVERARLIHPSPATPNNEEDDDREDLAPSSSSSPPSNGSKMVGEDGAVAASNGDEGEEAEFGKKPVEDGKNGEGRMEDEGRVGDGRMRTNDGGDGRDEGTRMENEGGGRMGDDGRDQGRRAEENGSKMVDDGIRDEDEGRGRTTNEGRVGDDGTRVGDDRIRDEDEGRIGDGRRVMDGGRMEDGTKGRGGPPVPLPPADMEEEDEDEEDGKKKLSMWDKFVLGIRCARQDCRDTLIISSDGVSASRPRVIDGRWKITRRARASENEQATRLCQCKDTELF